MISLILMISRSFSREKLPIMRSPAVGPLSACNITGLVSSELSARIAPDGSSCACHFWRRRLGRIVSRLSWNVSSQPGACRLRGILPVNCLRFDDSRYI
jgi:hypothetical protein